MKACMKDVGTYANGVLGRVVEWVKINTLGWFGQIERNKNLRRKCM